MTNKATIELTKKFNAPVAVLFDAIKDGQLLKSTGVKTESFKHDFRVDGEFFLEWTCTTAGSCIGRYLQIIPNQQIKFTWNSRGCESSPSSETVVTVTLLDHGRTSEMKLVHEGLDAGFCFEDHFKGWTSSIDQFVEQVERTVAVQ
jgi:uncharacterized protein YndB with AHSA1/START domain